ncbi:MAG TPA: amidohydrolase family protein, partial [Dehalococcoidia bacterium]|nr:amidohydrolase family protein [Dehalococcoidia bacterium]
TILPGLINVHGHLAFSAGEDPVGDMIADDDLRLMIRAVENARRALAAGVTTVRDLGDRGGVSVAVRNAINQGLMTGPRLLVSGAPITTTGGHCHFMGMEADHTDDLRRAVRQQVKAGVDLIKVMATGGGLTPGSNMAGPQYSVAELSALVEDAHRLNRRVAAHAHGTAGIRNAAAAGVDTVEHCSWRLPGDAFGYDEQAGSDLVKKGIFVCFTLAAGYRRVESGEPTDPVTAKRRADREQRSAIQRRLLDAGARVIAGSDAGVTLTPFDDFVLELELLVSDLGLTPNQAIAAATSVAAEALGIDQQVGTLDAGKQADLLLVGADPRRDISALRHVQAVYRDGVRVG